jgi:hypothetical protein
MHHVRTGTGDDGRANKQYDYACGNILKPPTRGEGPGQRGKRTAKSWKNGRGPSQLLASILRPIKHRFKPKLKEYRCQNGRSRPRPWGEISVLDIREKEWENERGKGDFARCRTTQTLSTHNFDPFRNTRRLSPSLTPGIAAPQRPKILSWDLGWSGFGPLVSTSGFLAL